MEKDINVSCEANAAMNEVSPSHPALAAPKQRRNIA
jgi:hypothetical protein